MRNYEFTVIFDTNEDHTEKGLEFVKGQLSSNGVNVTKEEDMSVKNLAYLIKKQAKGHYYYFELEADPACINKISDEMLLQNSILKFLFVVKN